MSHQPPPSPPETDIVQATQAWRDGKPANDVANNARDREDGFAAVSLAAQPLEKGYVQPPATMLLHPSIATEDTTTTAGPRLRAVDHGLPHSDKCSASNNADNIWATSAKNESRPAKYGAYDVGHDGTGTAKVNNAQFVQLGSPLAIFSGGNGAQMDHQLTWDSLRASTPPSQSFPPPPPQIVVNHAGHGRHPPPPGPPLSTTPSTRFYAPLASNLKHNGMKAKQSDQHRKTNPHVDDDGSMSSLDGVVTGAQAKEADKRASIRVTGGHTATHAHNKFGHNGPLTDILEAVDEEVHDKDEPSPPERHNQQLSVPQPNDVRPDVSISMDGSAFLTPSPRRATPLTGMRAPASTQYPTTLRPPNWTEVNSTASRSTDDAIAPGTIASSTAADPDLRDKHQNMDPIGVIREGLGWLPARYLEAINKDELKDLVLSAIESMNTTSQTAPQMAWEQQVRGMLPSDATDIDRQTSYAEDYRNEQETAGLPYSPTPYDANAIHEAVIGAEGAGAVSTSAWFEQTTSSEMPAGWTAEYDHDQRAWYFVNSNVNPPETSWDDPRGSIQVTQSTPSAADDDFDLWAPKPGQGMVPWPGGRPYPEYMSDPETARAYADWHAKTFAGFQAYRQYIEGKKGPVAATMDSERKRMHRLSRAQALIQEASRRLGEANSSPPSDVKTREKRAAECDLARAQGMMDRLQHDDEQRKAAVPEWMSGYEGITRGFEAPSERRRTHFVDAQPYKPRFGMHASHPPPMRGGLPMPQWPADGGGAYYGGMPAASNAFTPLPAIHYPAGDRTLPMPVGPPPGVLKQAAAAGGLRLPGSMNTPTVYPAPPGMRAKGSATPTPYGLPEACFAWDMVLRSTMATDKLARRPNYRGHDGAGNAIAQHPMAMQGMTPQR